MDKLKWRTIINEEILKEEFKLIVQMNKMPKEELNEKFNKLLNDPEQEIDEIKKIALVKAYFTYGDSVKEDDKKMREEAERKDKSETLEDVVNLPQKSQGKIKDMSLEEILEYDNLEDLLAELDDELK